MPLPFIIVVLTLMGLVMITEHTVLPCKGRRAAKITEEEGSRVSYEDIGGLHY